LGKPHGRGTLTWDDGCRYEGVFDYGQLTPEGKFHFADGRIYMGQLYKGRPKGRGILLSPEGRVIFAGFLVDEAPHGRGIRQGPNGPEYCIFEHGADITKPIRQLADEAVEAEEKALDALLNQKEAAEAEESPAVLPNGVTGTDTPEGAGEHASEALEPKDGVDSVSGTQDETQIIAPVAQGPAIGPEDMAEKRVAVEPAEVEEVIEEVTPSETEEGTVPDVPEEPDYHKQLEHMRLYRQWRLIITRKAISAEHQADLDQEKAWCDDELADGRDWCICAPFDPDAGQWRSCMR
jgi:hypothetical protein